jgi:hypothetical protein
MVTEATLKMTLTPRQSSEPQGWKTETVIDKCLLWIKAQTPKGSSITALWSSTSRWSPASSQRTVWGHLLHRTSIKFKSWTSLEHSKMLLLWMRLVSSQPQACLIGKHQKTPRINFNLCARWILNWMILIYQTGLWRRTRLRPCKPVLGRQLTHMWKKKISSWRWTSIKRKEVKKVIQSLERLRLKTLKLVSKIRLCSNF